MTVGPVDPYPHPPYGGGVRPERRRVSFSVDLTVFICTSTESRYQRKILPLWLRLSFLPKGVPGSYVKHPKKGERVHTPSTPSKGVERIDGSRIRKTFQGETLLKGW